MPIRPLDPSLVRHLAAGEVVDRPASLVKELLENALDAGATRIVLDIEAGGSQLVRIADDGHGIAATDIPHLLHRHSTSKIVDLADLQAIETLGFRGEALYSIAAVTRFRILTRHRDEDSGTELTKDDTLGLQVVPWGGPIGTTIEARELFYNVPARRKFLKGASAEFARIAEVAQRYALAHPEVSLEVTHNGRRLWRTPGTGLLEAILALYGTDTAGGVLRAAWSGPGVTVSGYVSPPSALKSSRKEQTLIVNGRWVRDHSLALAAERAYGPRLPEGRHPFFVLNITMPPDEVDVNVHPHKTEVRFADPNTLARAIYRATDTALASLMPLDTAPMERPLVASDFEWAEEFAPPAPVFRQESLPMAQALRSPMSLPVAVEEVDAAWTIDEDTGEVREALPPRSIPTLPTQSPVLGTSLQFGPGLFATLEDDTLVVVDLPALHARVLYAQLQAEDGPGASQPLLFPVPLALTAEASATMERTATLLEQMGFRWSADAAQLLAVPALLDRVDPASLFTDLLATLGADESLDVATLRDRAQRQAALRAADRSARVRAPQEIAWLLGQLGDHRLHISLTGQPTVLRLDPRWWAQMFGH